MYNLDRQGSFWLPCVSTARPRRGDWKDHEVVKTTKWSFPLVPVQQDSGVNWKASNRLIVQPQAHFPLLGECCLSLASKGACLTLASSQWQLGVVFSWWRIHLSMTDWSPGNVCVPLDVVRSGIGPTWFVVLLQLYPSWFCWGVSCLPCL